MKVEGMWPYWLDGHATNTVKNSFDMSSMYLLTGEPTLEDGLHYHDYAIINCYLLHCLSNYFLPHFVLFSLGYGVSCDSVHVLS